MLHVQCITITYSDGSTIHKDAAGIGWTGGPDSTAANVLNSTAYDYLSDELAQLIETANPENTDH